jgi:hypothetical protein
MSRSLSLYLEDIIEAIRKIRSYTSLLTFERIKRLNLRSYYPEWRNWIELFIFLNKTKLSIQ